MFDVDWTDYQSERVGQRRARKEVERDLKKKDERRSVRESISSRSSYSSGDKSHGLFGSLGLKISSASLRGKRASPKALSADDSASKRASILSQTPTTADDSILRRASILSGHTSAAPSASHPNSHAVVPERKLEDSIPPVAGHSVNPSTATSDNSTNRSSKGSVLSKSTATTTITVPSPGKSSVIDPPCTAESGTQTAEPGILVTKTTETTYEPRNGAKPAETQVVAIEAPSTTPVRACSVPSFSAPSSPNGRNTDVTTSVLIDKWFTSVNSPGSPLSPAVKDESPQSPHARSPHVSFELETFPVPFGLKPPIAMVKKTARSPGRKSTNSSMRLRANNPDAWKPPDNWDCPPTTDLRKSTISSSLSSSPRRQDVAEHPMSLDLIAMQREIARMAVASAEIVTVRLNENWGNSSDASFYRELEMEKKRWMLSALHNMRKYTEGIDMGGISSDSGKGKKMLALFESQATASYLAALHPEAQLTHLSPHPLSNILFPNVHPIPLAVGGLLPLSANRYSKVSCLSLPSMLPSPDIPRLLRSVHHCLIPKGILHLTVIDPSPATQSLGPRMRHWLDQNLILNLESQFRCISPSRLLPAWLADARLRADGSVISRVKFDAVYRPVEGGRIAEAELRSTVGRKLWQEVWGPFVLGAEWWWDDAACVEECVELGTYFEYSLIEAVKDTV